jgi:hypothetical protein
MLGAFLISTLFVFPSERAWRDAQSQVALRYPQFKAQIYAMKPPTLQFRRGIFFDRDLDKWVYGSCVFGREPEIIVGIVDDPAINLDSVIHEFKHAITFRLPLSSSGLANATRWIDQGSLQLTTRASRAMAASTAGSKRRRTSVR